MLLRAASGPAHLFGDRRTLPLLPCRFGILPRTEVTPETVLMSIRSCARWILLGLFLAQGSSSAPAQGLSLEDVLVGGDGTGNAPGENLGIDPDTGAMVTSLLEVDVPEVDGVNPAPVPAAPHVDSVFLLGPSATLNEVELPLIQPITRSLVSAIFPHDDGILEGFNAIARNRVGGLASPGIHVGGVDSFTTSIGIHASAGVTFDLDSLRAMHGAGAVGCFSAYWGLGDCPGGLANLHVILSNEGGVLTHSSRLFSRDTGDWIQLAIPPEARYLSLACGSAGAKTCDWGTFARPLITAADCPPPSFTWISSVSPARVRAFEPFEITLLGEGFNADQQVLVGGVPASGVHLNSKTELVAQFPELPPGANDVEVVVPGAGQVGVLRLGVYVVPRVTVTSVTPGRVFAGRPTPVEITGEGFTPFTAIHFAEVGPQGEPAGLMDPLLVSDVTIRGAAPPLSEGLLPGPRALIVEDGLETLQLTGLVTYVSVGLERVEPGVVSTSGGTVVRFLGAGLTPDLVATLGGVPLVDQELVGEGEITGKSPPLSAGAHDAVLADGEGLELRLPGAVQSLPPGALAITGVNPSVVSAVGGARLTITTSSFHLNLRPRVGGMILSGREILDATTLAGESPLLEPGRHALELVDDSGNVIAELPEAIEAISPADVALQAIEPAEVSTLGGTIVRVTGSGFTSDVVVRVGGLPLEDVRVLDAVHVEGRTGALAPGLHAVSAETSGVLRGVLADAVLASEPLLPAGFRLERVGPARISGGGGSRLRLVGAELPVDVVPRLNGIELEGLSRPTPCRILADAPPLAPGFYKLDLYRPGFGVVAEALRLVEVTGDAAPPAISHIGSSDVLPDGSTRLYIFGHDFRPGSQFLVGGKPLGSPRWISDELVLGNAPALDPGEPPGLRDMVVSDDRGSSITRNAVEYVAPANVAGTLFQRGDANESGRIDLSDAVNILGFLFLGSPESLGCEAASDIDGNGALNISDPIYLLAYLFIGGPEPGAPFSTCGRDPNPVLGCAAFAPCSVNGGAGGAAPDGTALRERVFFLPEVPTNPLDPVLVELDAESGEAVLVDAPGGLDLVPGDVINGLVPSGSETIHKGLSYLLVLGEETTGRCVAAGEGEKVHRVRSATLPEVFQRLEVQDLAVSYAGALVWPTVESKVSVSTCNAFLGGGGGEETDGGGGSDDSFVDVELRNNPLLQWDLFQDGSNYIRGGFDFLKLRYSAPSGLHFGIGIKQEGFSAPEVTRLTAFLGPLLDLEFDAYLKVHFEDRRKLEKKVYEVHKPKLFFIYGLAIFVDASTTVNVGVEIDAAITLDAKLGARAGYKLGTGISLDGSGFHDLTGYELPRVELLPDRPDASADGHISIRPFVRPTAKLLVGLEVALLTGSLEIDNEASLILHADASTRPVPCLRYGIDAAMTSRLRATFKALEAFTIYDHTWDLLGLHEPNFHSGEIGCLKPPVAVLKVTRNDLLGRSWTLDASESRDPDGGLLTYRWDFDGDGKCDRNTGHNPRTTLELDGCLSVGGCSETVVLTVIDEEREKARATARLRHQ